jgi:hypothetical protein
MGIKTAVATELEDSLVIRHLTPPLFVAIKRHHICRARIIPDLDRCHFQIGGKDRRAIDVFLGNAFDCAGRREHLRIALYWRVPFVLAWRCGAGAGQGDHALVELGKHRRRHILHFFIKRHNRPHM